ncbi:2-methylene-furan-3-one reductase-like [Neltuma alba]|uniref:2-methylene-furan-3-one reductase-like n=1 Tax=Neltuma alba TaxID=207710 RepID=UPI0010A2F77E|nr:2-methylene-furan-3-one reductase-like [Prosopis alba]XP_028804324.1 2-methylene-furan-3-one reductase-like [Prosopis alba]
MAVSSRDSSVPPHMKAWMYCEYGRTKQVLKIEESGVLPQLKHAQVLIKLLATALNPIDYHRMRSCFKHNDFLFPVLFLTGTMLGTLTTPSFDVGGVVMRVEREVNKFKEGEELYGDIIKDVEPLKQFGSLLAQYTIAEERLTHKYPNLRFCEATSLPLAIGTTFGSLKRVGLSHGQSILVYNQKKDW